MLKKTFNKLNISKMLLGVLVFFVASIGASAAEVASWNAYYICGNTCKYIKAGSSISGCSSTTYMSSTACKSKFIASRDAYYICGDSCKYIKAGSSIYGCSSTTYMTSTACKSNLNVGNTCGDSDYGKWKKSSCNSTVVSGKCHIWSPSKNCCSITNGSCSVYSSSSKKTPSSTTTITKYDISFNVMGGYSNTFPCPGNTSATSPGVCYGYVASGTTVNFPSSANSKELSKSDEGAFIGWTKELESDGSTPNCHTSKIDKTSNSVEVTSKTNYYACYKEIIAGYRFVQEGYVADGGSVDFPCGQTMYIEYCTIENGTDYCYYYENSTNTYRKVYRMKLVNTYEGAACSDTTTTEDYGYRYVTQDGQNYSCGDQLYITTCTDEACNYTKIKTSSKEISENETIDRNYLVESESSVTKACDKLENDNFDCSYQEMPGMMTSMSYQYCYNKGTNIDTIKDKISNLYTCADGYYFDNTVVVENGEEICDKNNKKCMNTFKVSCKKIDAKPTLSVTSGIVTGGATKGTISVTAKAKVGTITSYYVSSYYNTPTSKSNWQTINGNSFTIEDTPGVKYIWVRDSKGNISNAVKGVIIDIVNSDTTVQNIKLYDANGNVNNPVSSGTAYNVVGITDSKYVRLSNDLSKDSSVIADGFNPFDMEYELEVNSPTVTVYATLTSTDSRYVEGYEPRTVNLSYGINTILIKIQNNEGKVRTYTILVTRTDDRTSDNTLSDISLSVGNINFNANVTDYKIEIPISTETVDISSTIASDKASYVEGYEPNTIDILGDTTVKLIKVKSETGSTRTYVLTFIKEGTDEITNESLQLEDLVIPGVYIPFEENVSNYSLSVDYETDLIDLNTVLKDEKSIASISIKKKSDTEYRTVSSKGIGLDVGENFIEIKVINVDNEESYYRLTIIRKEFGLEISNDTTLKDLKVLDYDINFEPTKKEYTVRIKQEKSLVITAVPNSNRAEVFIRGNDELTGFSTVRVKVIAENGEFETYSIDIKKDAFNKTIEIASIIAGVVIILVSSGIIIIKKKSKANREYFEE